MNTELSIILVEAESPDNIGAAARAMKNMGLSDLRLVNPPTGWKSKAKKMAMSAYDVVKAAKVFRSLTAAVHDRNFILGTSRRAGAKRGQWISFDQAIQKTCDKKFRSAVVFGKESKGLANRDLALCDAVTTIPTQSVYPSLNLAQAVMVVCYALLHSSFPHGVRRESDPRLKSCGPACRTGRDDEKKTPNFLPKSEITSALVAFSAALKSLNYHDEVTKRILATLGGLIKRNGLIESEAQMIKGLSRRIVEKFKT